MLVKIYKAREKTVPRVIKGFQVSLVAQLATFVGVGEQILDGLGEQVGDVRRDDQAGAPGFNQVL